MGNCKLEHHRSHVNIAPPILSKLVVVETYKQHVGIKVINHLM
jgi:hypothetical protein